MHVTSRTYYNVDQRVLSNLASGSLFFYITVIIIILLHSHLETVFMTVVYVKLGGQEF